MKKVFFLAVLSIFLFSATNSSLAQNLTNKEIGFLGSMVGGIDVCQKEIEEDIGIKEFEKLGKKIIKIITIKKLGENKTFTDAVGESEKDERDARKNNISKGFVCMVRILWAKGVLLGLKFGLK